MIEGRGVEAVLTRIVEGSPVIVLVLGIFAAIIWRTWRTERSELLAELREERRARATAHTELITAVTATRDALVELRHALERRA